MEELRNNLRAYLELNRYNYWRLKITTEKRKRLEDYYRIRYYPELVLPERDRYERLAMIILGM